MESSGPKEYCFTSGMFVCIFPRGSLAFLSICLASFRTPTSSVSFSSPSVSALPYFLCLNIHWLLFNSSLFLLFRLWKLLLIFFSPIPPAISNYCRSFLNVRVISECCLCCLIWDTTQTISTLCETGVEDIVPHMFTVCAPRSGLSIPISLLHWVSSDCASVSTSWVQSTVDFPVSCDKWFFASPVLSILP